MVMIMRTTVRAMLIMLCTNDAMAASVFFLSKILATIPLIFLMIQAPTR